MFYPHRATILTRRAEPTDLDVAQATAHVRRRHAALAERLVLRDLLQPRKVKAKTLRRISRQLQEVARRQDVQDFMAIWNHWRAFYFNLPPIQPKTGGQLTQIEALLAQADGDERHLRMLVAATHRAFVWRKVNPGFGDALLRGEEFVQRHAHEVVADVDQRAYRAAALTRGAGE